MPRKRFTPEQRKRIVDAWREYHTVGGVAEELCVTWDTARRWLALLCVREDSTMRIARLSQRTQKLWRNPMWLRWAYVESRYSPTQIATLAGCCTSTVMNWLRRFGIPVRDNRVRGERCHSAKLTEAQVREAREEFENDKTLACRERLAEEFGVALVTVNKVVYRMTWRHVA